MMSPCNLRSSITSHHRGLCILLLACTIIKAEFIPCRLRTHAVLEHVWAFNGTLYTNASQVKEAGYCKFGISSINYTQGMPTTYTPTPWLVTVDIMPFKAWYHVLLENALPALRASLEHGIIKDRSLASVWFTFRKQPDKESSPAFSELLHLFYKHVWLDVPAMVAWGAAQPPVYFPKAIIVTRPPAYFSPGADWASAVNALREYTTTRMVNLGGPAPFPPAPSEDRTTASEDIATPIDPDAPPDAVLIVRTTMRRFAGGHQGILQRMQAQGLRVHIMTNPSTLYEQWWPMYHAKVVVAGHGSALSNLVFMQPGTAVVEITPHRFLDPTYRNWAHMLGIRYFEAQGLEPSREHLWIKLRCRGPVPEPDDCRPGLPAMDLYECCSAWWHNQDLVVDVPRVEAQLRRAVNTSYEPVCRGGSREEIGWPKFFTCE